VTAGAGTESHPQADRSANRATALPLPRTKPRLRLRSPLIQTRSRVHHGLLARTLAELHQQSPEHTIEPALERLPAASRSALPERKSELGPGASLDESRLQVEPAKPLRRPTGGVGKD